MLGVCESLSMVVQNYTVLVGGLAITNQHTVVLDANWFYSGVFAFWNKEKVKVNQNLPKHPKTEVTAVWKIINRVILAEQ
jgi:hypothetical protein